MAMIDAYYGNNRPPSFFAALNDDEELEGARPQDFECIIESSGYTYSVATSYSEVARGMKAGMPSIVGERSVDAIGHITIPISVQICFYQNAVNINTDVMDPGEGRVMPRSTTYWKENNGLEKYIIYNDRP